MNGIEVIGFTEARAMLDGIQRRLEDPSSALRPEVEVIEREEAAIFGHWHGKYVATGRAMRSLTEHGADAVRLVHGAELVFGTAVEYVRYLTEERIGRHHRGRNAVMISPFEIEAADPGQRVLHRIVR